MKSLRLLFVILFALTWHQRPLTVEHGSTGLVYRTPDYVALGADSLLREGDTFRQTCKIRRAGKFVFAYAGLSRLVSETDTAFDVPKLAREAAERGAALSDAAKTFEGMATPAFAGVLDRYRADQPSDYAVTVAREGLRFYIVFAAFEDSPAIAFRRFDASLENGRHVVRITARNCPGDCATGTILLTFGANVEIDRFMKGTPDFPALVGYETAFDFLIRLEAAKSPKLVALPIDILVLDKDGARWIRAKQECK